MKKLTILCAAIAALVGCSKESTTVIDAPTSKVTMVASIDVEPTRVTVGGETFTDVKWVEQDVVKLVSVGGTSMSLTATEGGDANVRFEGTGDVMADVDTYYAIYPAVEITDGVATLDLTAQSGQDVAVLVSKAADMPKSDIQMSFKPANSLLHVSVSGAGMLSKAEFMAYGDTMLPEGFAYAFDADATQNYGEVASYAITAPSTAGFFFSLPADLDMTNGYVVRLTDVYGNVCTKAYNGKTFERGTTTRVDIEWSEPTVTLGAKTSYSYYLAGDSASANRCASTDVFFVTGINGESCASSYANVQDAVITDLGYEVDGITYTYSAGQVSWDKASNTFCLNSAPSCSVSVGELTSVKAFVVVGGKKYYSNNNLWITGLPYSYNFVDGSLDAYRNAGWSTNGQLRVENETLAGHSSTLVLHHYRSVFGRTTNESGYVVSPQFHIPADVSVQPQIVRHAYSAGVITTKITKTGYVGAVNSTTAKSTTVSFSDTTNNSTGDTKSGSGDWLSAFSISPSYPYISISCCTTAKNSGTYYFIYEAHFRYAEE